LSEEEVVVEVEPGGIYRGTVLRQQGSCALVKLECGDEGSLHYSKTEAQKVPALNATVWAKVLRIENNGRKIVLSTKNIDQETGKLKITLDAAGEPVCQGKLDESEWGRSMEPGRMRIPKGGRVFLAEALGDGFTADELAKVFVVSKKKPEHLQGFTCATRDGTRLVGINAIKSTWKGCATTTRHRRLKPPRRPTQTMNPGAAVYVEVGIMERWSRATATATTGITSRASG